MLNIISAGCFLNILNRQENQNLQNTTQKTKDQAT